MKLKWTRLALSDFAEAHTYIADENPQAALAVAQRIQSAAHVLKDQPRIGRSGEMPGTYEWLVPGTAYVLVYRIVDDAIEILHLWHGKQNWRQ